MENNCKQVCDPGRPWQIGFRSRFGGRVRAERVDLWRKELQRTMLQEYLDIRRGY